MPTRTSALHWNGATGARTEDGPEFTAVWAIDTDDAQDQADGIIEYFRANVADLGDSYAYAGDTNAEALAKRIRARRDLRTTGRWLVTVSYAPLEDEDGKDSDGNATDNPLDFRPVIRSNTVQYQRPVDVSKFLGGYHGDAAAMFPIGDYATPCNSAGVPFNPRPMRDDSRTVVNITRNLAVYDSDDAEAWTNTVNLNDFQIMKFGFVGSFGKRTTRIRAFSGDLRRQNGVDFWEASCVLDRDPRRWFERILDQGVHARALDGDPDGRGGQFSPNRPRAAGVPQLRRLVDDDEMPISDPVLFDGDGQPLPLDVWPIEPVFGNWLHYEEQPFEALAFLSGIIS